MAYNEQLAERVRRGFGKRGVQFDEKRMMGGLCFMVNGKMCVGVEQGRLMVRIDPEMYEAASKRKGCGPMDFTGRPMRGYVFVTLEGLSTDGELGSWLDLALEFNPKAVPSRKKQKISSQAVLRRAPRSS